MSERPRFMGDPGDPETFVVSVEEVKVSKDILLENTHGQFKTVSEIDAFSVRVGVPDFTAERKRAFQLVEGYCADQNLVFHPNEDEGPHFFRSPDRWIIFGECDLSDSASQFIVEKNATVERELK